MSVESLVRPGIETSLWKPYKVSEIPSRDERVLRQEIMQLTTLIEAPKAGKFVEREIDPDKPWSAFGQIMFVKDHGNGIKKIAAVSIAYPGGAGTRMATEILSKTSGIEEEGFKSWKGLKEGSIVAASKMVGDVTGELDMMGQFIENSGKVITERHAQSEHEVVQHFFGLQDARRGFMQTVQQDAAAILENPEFTGRSAFDPRYKEKGIYLIEGIIKDGVWYGGDPNGEEQRLVNMAADDPHRRWLEWAEETAVSMKGDGIIVDAEDTETVTDCGGNKGCSQFFDDMEGVKEVSGNKTDTYSEISGISQTLKASQTNNVVSKSGGGKYDNENCFSCGRERNNYDGCKCSA